MTAAYGAQDIALRPRLPHPASPFDPRLITKIAPAVAQAAMDSGVATRPIADIEAYRRSLQRFVYRSGTVMQPVFAAAAKRRRKRIVYAEGEDERVLRAAQVVVDEGLATPILVGRPDVIAQRSRRWAFACNPAATSRSPTSTIDATLSADAAEAYYQRRKRHGLVAGTSRSRNAAQQHPDRGDAAAAAARRTALLCGTFGAYAQSSALRRGGHRTSGRGPQLRRNEPAPLPRHTLFICDPYIHLDPTAEEIAEMAVLAAAE